MSSVLQNIDRKRDSKTRSPWGQGILLDEPIISSSIYIILHIIRKPNPIIAMSFFKPLVTSRKPNNRRETKFCCGRIERSEYWERCSVRRLFTSHIAVRALNRLGRTYPRMPHGRGDWSDGRVEPLANKYCILLGSAMWKHPRWCFKRQSRSVIKLKGFYIPHVTVDSVDSEF